MSFDFSLFQSIYNFTGRWKALDWLMIFFADYLAYILIIIFITVLWRFGHDTKRRLYYFSYSLLALLFARGIIAEGFRLVYPRSRPFAQFDFDHLIAPLSSSAFPSGHATVFFTLAFVLFFIGGAKKSDWLIGPAESGLPREQPKLTRIGMWFLVGAILMGIARVFVGVHFPLDILGGAGVAFVSVFVINRFLPLRF